MKNTTGRGRGERDEGEKYMGLLKLVQILSFLVVFVAGIIIGLATSSHMNQFFTSQSLLFSTNRFSAISQSSMEQNCSVVQTCEDIDYSRFEKFIHPEKLSHKLSDDELLWRASMVPYREDEYPFQRTVKVAFMFLTRGPLPMLPLWEKFFKGHEKYFSIYVHALPGYKLEVSKDSPFYGRQIPSQVIFFFFFWIHVFFHILLLLMMLLL